MLLYCYSSGRGLCLSLSYWSSTDRTDQLIRMIRDQITIIRSIFFFFKLANSLIQTWSPLVRHICHTYRLDVYKSSSEKEKDDLKVGHPHSRVLISRSLSLKKNEAAILSIKDFPKYIDKFSQNGCKISHLMLRSRNIISPLLQLSAEAWGGASEPNLQEIKAKIELKTTWRTWRWFNLFNIHVHWNNCQWEPKTLVVYKHSYNVRYKSFTPHRHSISGL